MKDYIYYIPGYTGFCPDLPNHFGESYGKATHQIIRQRPQDLLRERLSDVRYGERKRGTYYSAYHGDHYHNSNAACCGRPCCDSCCRYCRKDECIYKLPKYKEWGGGKSGMAGKQICIQPIYAYFEGYVAPRSGRGVSKGNRPCCDSCCDWKTMPRKQCGSVQDNRMHMNMVEPTRKYYAPPKGNRPCCDTCCDWKSMPRKPSGWRQDYGGHMNMVEPPRTREYYAPPKGNRPCCDTCCDWKFMPRKQCGRVQARGVYEPAVKVVVDQEFGSYLNGLLRKDANYGPMNTRCC